MNARDLIWIIEQCYGDKSVLFVDRAVRRYICDCLKSRIGVAS